MKTILMTYLVFGAPRTCTVTTDQLMDAIAVVESNRGATSRNVYQLRKIYVADVCRITGQRITHAQAIGDDAIARACIEAYWNHYGTRYSHITGASPDAEVLARIHNGGPDGWRKPETMVYWRKVREALFLNGFKATKGGVK